MCPVFKSWYDVGCKPAYEIDPWFRRLVKAYPWSYLLDDAPPQESEFEYESLKVAALKKIKNLN